MEFRLVKAGYGSLERIRSMNSREFLQAIAYERFIGDYEASYFHINKGDQS